MKKWVFLLLLIVCIGFGGVKIAAFFQDKGDIYRNVLFDKGNTDNSGNSESTQNKEISTDLVYQGNLLLVNGEYPIHEQGVKSDIVNLFKHQELTKGYGLLNTNIYLSKDVAQKFSELAAAAEQDGVNHFLISSGYRGIHEQSVLYREMGSSYALPAGHSEHNLGLSLDIGSSQMKMEEAPEGKWIEKNAWKYGFILRYPKDKTEITGIKYEPWHIRYVGLPHSIIIHEKNLAFEEYLDYLKRKKEITATADGTKYTVSYYPFTHGKTIQVQVKHHYEISGNNMDGVIVTESE